MLVIVILWVLWDNILIRRTVRCLYFCNENILLGCPVPTFACDWKLNRGNKMRQNNLKTGKFCKQFASLQKNSLKSCRCLNDILSLLTHIATFIIENENFYLFRHPVVSGVFDDFSFQSKTVIMRYTQVG